MKVCDRHPDRRAIDTIVISHDDARIDLCGECKTEVLMFLSSVPTDAQPAKMNGSGRKRGRPRKDSAEADTQPA